MRFMRWLAILAACILIISCFFPWVTVNASKEFVATGFDAVAIGFGKPALVHTFFSVLFIIFLLIRRIWSLRTSFFISAFNVAWAIRNFVLMGTCRDGICPTKHTGIYVMLTSSILMLVFILFSDVKAKEK